MRELVGDDGDAIVQLMYDVMTTPNARTADRLETGRWLGDRGFGRSVQPVDLDVNHHLGIDITTLSTSDLEALLAILDKYELEVVEMTPSGEIPFRRGNSRSVDAPAGGNRLRSRRN